MAGNSERYIQGGLGDLKWHWGSAYTIMCTAFGKWLAWRKDDRTLIRAEDAEALRLAIRADYTARPMPRGLTPCRCGWSGADHDFYLRCPPMRPRGRLASLTQRGLRLVTRYGTDAR